VDNCHHPTISGVSSPSSTALANQRILLIDTKTINYQVLQTYASLWSLQIDRATSVPDALMILRQGQQWKCPYTLAIVDNAVPDATTLPRQLASDPQLAGTPSVLMASLNQRDIPKQYHQLGFSAYVLKPLKQSRLSKCLQAVLTNASDSNPQDPSTTQGKSSNAHTSEDSTSETGLSEDRTSEMPVSAEPLHNTDSSLTELVSDMPRPKTDHSSPDSKSPAAQQAPIKILVVEDTPLNQRVILKLLKRLKYDCDLVENGQAALDAMANRQYDIVLMDCQMPILDGYSATQQLRQREQQADPTNAHHTVVIAMTAHAITGDRDKCLDAGMDDYLSKPIFKESLAEKLDYWSRWILNNRRSPTSQSSVTVDTVPPVPSSELIHWPHLQRVAEGDREFALELVQLFLKGNQPNLSLAREAIANRDLAKVRHIAHQIKGSASNVGLIGISQIADKLESQAQRGSVEGMETLVDELDTLFTQVQLLQQQ
ncbi:MAG: response regulator, partial [Cyanobacteria bacterium]|nr:response regulator [Cyanobacteriota bacterium]MDW8200475.1 response regulator [Cyanobacteriota bacterium SKYGB_h_bin112]